MMVAEDTLPDTLQALIDARLDTIDRMLFGRVPRADRLAIVREVESQIEERLAERSGGSVGREEILAVLARLDPPEAYLGDDEDFAARATVAPRSPVNRETRPVGRPIISGLSRAAGILGLVSIGSQLMAGVMLALAVGGNFSLAPFFFFAFLGSGFSIGIVALTLATIAKLTNRWSITGLTGGIVSTLVSMGYLAYAFQS